MSQTPRIPAGLPAGIPGAIPAATQGPALERAHGPASKLAGAKPAFEVLLERLTSRAAELEEKSKTLDAPDELPGAVDAARASLEDALELGAELLEAYRVATTRAPEVRP